MNKPVAVLVDFDVDAVGDGWTELADAGRAIAAGHERNRWVLGDLAARVTSIYGDDSLGKYVYELGGKIHYKAMTDYRTVSGFYPRDVRDVHPHLSWSHYREAKRLKDFEAAMDALDGAADKNWTVEELRASIDSALNHVRTTSFRFTASVVLVGKRTVVLALDEGDMQRFKLNASEGTVLRFSAHADKGGE